MVWGDLLYPRLPRQVGQISLLRKPSADRKGNLLIQKTDLLKVSVWRHTRPNQSLRSAGRATVQMPGLESNLPLAARKLKAFKMLRVTLVDSSDSVVRLRVEGRLIGRSVEELRQACDLHAPVEGARLILDVADVSFADSHGIEILRDLQRNGAALVNLLPYLALQLHDPQTGRQPPPNKGDAAEGDGRN